MLADKFRLYNHVRNLPGYPNLFIAFLLLFVRTRRDEIKDIGYCWEFKCIFGTCYTIKDGFSKKKRKNK